MTNNVRLTATAKCGEAESKACVCLPRVKIFLLFTPSTWPQSKYKVLHHTQLLLQF